MLNRDCFRLFQQLKSRLSPFGIVKRVVPSPQEQLSESRNGGLHQPPRALKTPVFFPLRARAFYKQTLRSVNGLRILSPTDEHTDPSSLYDIEYLHWIKTSFKLTWRVRVTSLSSPNVNPMYTNNRVKHPRRVLNIPNVTLYQMQQYQ